MSTSHRLPLIDALKAVACTVIVWHHLALYGPMSDIAQPLAPWLISWLYDYGRMAVQVFLVVGGFLAAGALAPQGAASFERPVGLIWRRYLRLVLPYLVALAVSVLVAALVRPWFDHPSVPEQPSLLQILTHILLLQDLLGYEALSAGVWYVAIDFQLFALTVLVFSFARWARGRWPAGPAWLGAGLVLVLAVGSLAWFNRVSAMDNTALYFMGSYGLGLLAFWGARSPLAGRWLIGIAVLGTLALVLDFRERIAVACLTALALAWAARQPWAMRWPRNAWLLRLGQMSYSVFLIHFPVCLLVNAVVGRWWPTQPLANAFGMLAAFVLSVAAGWALYRGVEARRAPRAASLKLGA